jgi:hypothetical protein
MSRNSYSTFTFDLRTRRAHFRHTVETCVTVATACEVERRGLGYFECAHSCLASTVYTRQCVPLACRGHGIFGNVCAFACRRHPLPVIKSLPGSVPLMAAVCHSVAQAGRIHQLQLLEFSLPRVHGSRVRLRLWCTWWPVSSCAHPTINSHRLRTYQISGCLHDCTVAFRVEQRSRTTPDGWQCACYGKQGVHAHVCKRHMRW